MSKLQMTISKTLKSAKGGPWCVASSTYHCCLHAASPPSFQSAGAALSWLQRQHSWHPGQPAPHAVSGALAPPPVFTMQHTREGCFQSYRYDSRGWSSWLPVRSVPHATIGALVPLQAFTVQHMRNMYTLPSMRARQHFIAPRVIRASCNLKRFWFYPPPIKKHDHSAYTPTGITAGAAFVAPSAAYASQNLGCIGSNLLRYTNAMHKSCAFPGLLLVFKQIYVQDCTHTHAHAHIHTRTHTRAHTYTQSAPPHPPQIHARTQSAQMYE
eukprot:1158515-Pelagomonas_calceolata.AAC.4